MISSPPANQSGRSLHEAWSPPPFLLEVAAGDDSLIPDVIDAFNTDTLARIREIRTALAASEFSKIQAEAHAIKGAAGQVGADAVANACQELETASNLQEALLVAARLNHLQELFEEISRAMASHSSSRSIGSVPSLRIAR